MGVGFHTILTEQAHGPTTTTTQTHSRFCRRSRTKSPSVGSDRGRALLGASWNATKCIPGSSCCKGLGARSTGLGRRPRLSALRRAAKSGGGGSVLAERSLGRWRGREGSRCAHCGQRRTGRPAEAAAAAALSGERGELRNPVTRVAPVSGWTQPAGSALAATAGRSVAPRAAQRSLKSQETKSETEKKILVSVDLWLR